MIKVFVIEDQQIAREHMENIIQSGKGERICLQVRISERCVR